MIEYFKMAVTEKYAQFEGRSTRSEYWYFVLAYTLLAIVIGLISSLLVYASGGSGIIIWILGIGFILAIFALIIPSISLAVRRLHDTGKSGWWYLINFVPYIGGLVFIVLMCLESEPGANQYGPNLFELDSGDDISGHLLKDDLV